MISLKDLKKNSTFLKKIWTYLRYPLIIATFFLIFRNVNFEKIGSSFSHIRWWTVYAFMFCAFSGVFFQGVRWWILIYAFTKKLTFIRSMVIHFSSAFYSLILPNSTVQEIVRTVYATKTTGYVIGWSSAWICKIMGIVISFSFSVAGLLLLPNISIPPAATYIIYVLFALMCIALALSFTKKITRPVRKIIINRFPKLPIEWFEKLREGIYRFRDKKRMLGLSFLATVMAQTSLLSGVCFLLYGITGNTYFLEVTAFIPLIEMISMAQPFTPGGIGVRDALIALMFQHLNLTTEQLAVFLVVNNLSILVKLTGLVPVVYEAIKQKSLKEIVKPEQHFQNEQ